MHARVHARVCVYSRLDCLFEELIIIDFSLLFPSPPSPPHFQSAVLNAYEV